MAVGTINNAKELGIGYKPMLLAVITFTDSVATPTVLRIATTGLNSADGSFIPTISGFPHSGQAFLTALKNQELAATQALSEQGVDITPTVTLEFVDVDKTIWAKERTIGFKGAEMELYFIFWNVGQNDFSSDWRNIFTGVCGPAQVGEKSVNVTAISRMNMNQKLLPTIRIQKRCPWVFPVTAGLSTPEATALHQDAADNPSSPFWNCGYSPLASGANARGNLDGANPYTGCNYTFENCIQRLGNDALVFPPFAPIEKDKSGRLTGRFGGVRWDQPTKFQSRGYGEKSTVEGLNTLNEAKYNDYAPMGWGTFWVDPVILNVVGDANFTRMEALVGIGEYSQIRKVIVNDIEVDKWSGAGYQLALQLHWRPWNTGDRTGAVNKDTIYDGTGDPYGGLTVISITIPRQLSPSSSIPRVRCLVDGAKIHKYQAITSISVTGGVATATLVGANTDIASNGTFPFVIAGNSKTDVNGNYSSLTNWTYGPPGTIQFPTAAANGSGTGGYIQYDAVTSNPAWILMDVLAWLGWKYAKLDLASFMDAAAYYAEAISFKNIYGVMSTHPRFSINFGIRQRAVGSDLVRQIRTSCRSTLAPHPVTGALQLLPDRTLAMQQPAPVDGSNYNTAVKSKNNSGADANGYVAYKFSYSTILPKNAQGESSFSLEQLPVQSAPNKVSFTFADEENNYQMDSLTVIDAEDVRRSGQEVNGQIPVIGIPNFDQSRRIIAGWMARNFRGNQRKDTGGTYTFTLETSYRCVHLRIGHIVLVDYPQYGLNAGLESPPATGINGFLARVIAIKPSVNFERVTLVLQYHDDDWYVDTFGQEDAPKRENKFRDRLTRPALPWLPDAEAPLTGDYLFHPSDRGFAIQQIYDLGADSNPIPKVVIGGRLPVNKFAGDGLKPPSINPQGTTAPTGGTIPAGKKYYAIVCGRDADGLLTPGSDSDVPCEIDVPAGADTATVTIPILQWGKGTVKGEVFLGEARNKLSHQLQVTVTDEVTPSSVNLSALNRASWGLPDVEFDTLILRWKLIQHLGILGAGVSACTATTIKLFVNPDNGFTTNQFAPSSGKYYCLMLLAFNGPGILPICNWRVDSNTADTLTVTGPDPTAITRGDGTTGLKEGDVVVLCMRPIAGSDAGGNYVEDPNYINALNPLADTIQIATTSGASPVVVTTETNHGLLSGHKVYISNVQGTSIPNGVRWVTHLTDTTFEIYSDSARTTPVNGGGNAGYGGVVQRQLEGLNTNEGIGTELYILKGKGEGSYYKVKSNTATRIYIEGEWDVVPDETSVIAIMDPVWRGFSETGSVDNSKEDAGVQLDLEMPNYSNWPVFIQAFTRDGSRNEAWRALSPWRVIWLYGAQAAGAASLAAIHLTVSGVLGIDTDIAPRVRPNMALKVLGVRSEVKTAPTGAGLTIQLYADTNLLVTLTIPAGQTMVTATQAQINAMSQIPADANVRLDITGVGTTFPGEDLSVTVYS